jgi:hypothetical protein
MGGYFMLSEEKEKEKENKRQEIRFDKGWMQFIVTILILIVGISVAWGTYVNKVGDLENQVTGLENGLKEIRTDHDAIISLSTKMDLIMADIKEIKCDLKKSTNR